MLGGMALVPLTMSCNAQAVQFAASNAGPASAAVPAALPDIPSLPKGKSTIMGGSIHDVDPVRDQFTLRVYGIHPMKILFDERTQIFRDGKRIAVRDLVPSSHVSVQTTLDEGQVFAVSVHILSHLPEGDYQGRVVSYNAETRELTLVTAQGGRPFRLLVSGEASFERQGQSAFSSTPASSADLVPGSLVTIKFNSDPKGKGVASAITVLATPGSRFLFSGSLTALNASAGFLVLVDPRYDTSYQISFDPHAPDAQNLHVGQNMRISAEYDGQRYVANEIAPQ